ncbi:MAG TPA: hypothetical protein VHE12_01490, partial [bacterium]|nr:hypothetical protein [bacterium]
MKRFLFASFCAVVVGLNMGQISAPIPWAQQVQPAMAPSNCGPGTCTPVAFPVYYVTPPAPKNTPTGSPTPTITSTPTKTNTPTITPTPTVTLSPTPMSNKVKLSNADGTYDDWKDAAPAGTSTPGIGRVYDYPNLKAWKSSLAAIGVCIGDDGNTCTPTPTGSPTGTPTSSPTPDGFYAAPVTLDSLSGSQGPTIGPWTKNIKTFTFFFFANQGVTLATPQTIVVDTSADGTNWVLGGGGAFNAATTLTSATSLGTFNSSTGQTRYLRVRLRLTPIATCTIMYQLLANY